MGIVPLIIATLCYVWAAADLAWRKNYPMSGVFLAYAAANCFLIYAAYRDTSGRP